MRYQGVKFKTEMVKKEVPNDPRIEALKYWARLFHHYGLAPPYEGGSYGNLSFRLQRGEDPFIITGSKIGLKDKLSADCFAKVLSCNLKKGIVYAAGIKEPSSETLLHFAIYRERRDVNAVFHGHSKEILNSVSKLKIPETTKEEPYGTVELVQKVLEILDGKFFLVMKNHGFISLGRTIKEAGKLTFEMYRRCFP